MPRTPQLALAAIAAFSVACGDPVGLRQGGDPTMGMELPAVSLHSAPAPAPQVEMGYAHSCVLKTNGTVTCWGDNSQGQTEVPSGLSAVVEISSLYNHTCAVTANGALLCWGGGNLHGEIDVPVGLGAVKQASAGETHTCAVKVDGMVACWGYVRDERFPLIVPPGLANVVKINSGPNFACAVKSDGGMVCWGDTDDAESDVPSWLGSVQQSSGGHEQNCALKTDGYVVCWGQGWWSRPAASFEEMIPNWAYPNQVPFGLSEVTQVRGGGMRACVLRRDGSVICWDATNKALPLSDLVVADAGSSVGLDHHVGLPRYCLARSTGAVTCTAGANAGIAPPSDLNLYMSQTIVIAPIPSWTVHVGGGFRLAAKGGGSSNPVLFSSRTPAICLTGKNSIGQQWVIAVAAGNCEVAANQAGGNGYLAAAEQTLAFFVAAK